MTSAEILEKAKTLPVEERLKLARMLRDNLAENGCDVDFTSEQIVELERRAEEARKNATAGICRNK
jgi:putative addiction module component (TIGR02574 family)